ncbi:MBL fold metallo-hydrolase [Acinetobacter chinensis]|jgi:glyoxylase-like metal-dependent hydrolase (beta-lactamase superfamily II)|uniref:MBL fold metallo-hydrolase n=1 Tax=Acinetobacter chinensis TaxID=2004650 RepID=UPI002934E6E1|nr:MBL fold metallo-hydrolase [Acinetobacter chinensis]WOE43174.1 MBL fold metallo-hydrolase [Acinetobacter chinensis]
MKIYHLNCGTLCPLCAKLINGHGTFIEPGRLICHCLLIEHQNKLMMVDTGIGLKDIQQPDQRLGKFFQKSFKPKLAVQETAFEQIKMLGYKPEDVTDLFPTHLDLDHAGGFSDFPQAKVHIYKPELDQILYPSFKDKIRFRKNQFTPSPHWKTYEQTDSVWFGLEAISLKNQLGINLFMIPLTGHTKGHTGIAIQQDSGKWLLHCGDAYYHHSQLDADNRMPSGLRLFEKLVQAVPAQRIKNLNTLKQLKRKHSDEIEFFCAHDPVELNRYQD